MRRAEGLGIEPWAVLTFQHQAEEEEAVKKKEERGGISQECCAAKAEGMACFQRLECQMPLYRSSSRKT